MRRCGGTAAPRKDYAAVALRSDCDPLDLIERDLVAGAVLEFGGARGFVRRHGLRVLDRDAGKIMRRELRALASTG